MLLAVELHGTVVGELEGGPRTFDFTPNKAAVERFGANSTILSVAIPLTPAQRRDWADRRRNWFAELLPEGDQYDYMLVQGGIRNGDTLAFLARYGRDVAGALQIWDLDDPSEPLTPSMRPVTETRVRELLEDPIGAPLANDQVGGKSSLGGVQPKVVLIRSDAGWAQSLGGYPTTHILKPQLSGNKASIIFDEEYGSRIARRLGLADFATSIERFDGLSALVIERFDRDGGDRVHQEDFNQALGASGNQKSQSIGGIVSLQRVAETLRRNASDADMVQLARMVMLTVGIGNLDMHTKNFSLLHSKDGGVSLAPAYDVVPQAHLSRDGELALAVNRKYRHADITRDDLIAEFSKWGLSRSATIIDAALEEIANAVDAESPLEGAFLLLQAQILGFIDNLRNGRSVGCEK